MKLGSRPARYFLKGLAEQKSLKDLETSAAVDAPTTTATRSFKEIQLHPFLARFVYTQFRAYGKTINHLTSNKKEFGEWVHPDVIAVFGSPTFQVGSLRSSLPATM
jgi:uncharacterized protein